MRKRGLLDGIAAGLSTGVVKILLATEFRDGFYTNLWPFHFHFEILPRFVLVGEWI